MISAINNRYLVYNQELDKVNKLEKEKKIFFFFFSKFVDIKRIERNIEKIQEMYDLGKEDAIKNLASMFEYLKSEKI